MGLRTETVRQLCVRAIDVGYPVSTPVGLARRLARLHTPVMILDGVPIDDGLGRGCLVAAGAALRFTARGRAASITWAEDELPHVTRASDPLDRLVRLAATYAVDGPRLPDALASLAGFIAYDAVRGFERLPAHSTQQAGLPDYEFFLPTLAVLFREDGPATAIARAPRTAESALLLQRLVRDLNRAGVHTPASNPDPLVSAPRASFTQDEYTAAVGRAKEYILDGDIFQVVLSVRWDLPYTADPLSTYERLVALNPSPLQYCYIGPDFQVVGASPEPLVTANGGQCTVRPLAGTRRRGGTNVEDRALERELRSSEKEQAEHRMLVDLARNDLGRVCRAGSVQVDQLMDVERYSHVMHMVSNVVGELSPRRRIDDLARSCFPAGTMTGAPKIRAMEIIDELEPVARGLYSGAVGLIGANYLHLYITIRSLVAQNGRASLQAGAGIVHDSVPEAEYQECLAKLQSGLASLGLDRRQPRDFRDR
jgi:anthranilate synthase component I